MNCTAEKKCESVVYDYYLLISPEKRYESSHYFVGWVVSVTLFMP